MSSPSAPAPPACLPACLFRGFAEGPSGRALGSLLGGRRARRKSAPGTKSEHPFFGLFSKGKKSLKMLIYINISQVTPRSASNSKGGGNHNAEADSKHLPAHFKDRMSSASLLSIRGCRSLRPTCLSPSSGPATQTSRSGREEGKRAPPPNHPFFSLLPALANQGSPPK